MTIIGIFYQVVLEKVVKPTRRLVQDEPILEQIIREDFDHFNDVYLRGDGNSLMRQRTARLCEAIVQHVLRELPKE